MVKLRGHEEYPIYFGASPEILRLAGNLRDTMTHSEKLLWIELRNRKINGFRFRRQHPVSEVIVDFFCYEAMLAVEIDGNVHEDPFQMERDLERTTVLNRLGIEVIRFSNNEVEKNIPLVIQSIKMKLQQKSA